MKPFRLKIRRKDLVAVAVLLTVCVPMFLAVGLLWKAAESAVMSVAFWFWVWKTAKTSTTNANAGSSNNSGA
jgi:hypothetical protein